MIRLTGLEKSFDGVPVLKGIDLEVATGSVVAVLGPSGSGKSTLLRCINFLERPQKGIIEVGDVRVDAEQASKADILALRQQTAMVFQQFNLFKNLTVLRNVTLGLTEARKMSRIEAEALAREVLETVGLTEKFKAYPSQLSGGQQQRVAIARALALKPEVLLFDEPTSALDPELAEDVLQCIKDVAERGNTLLLVTHEIGFAYEVADRIVLIDGGEISEQAPTKEFFHNPQTERGKQFLINAMKRFIIATDVIPKEEGEGI
ncbi:MAG: amino acid ABC transporter ATP-binding protein [Coriobacteriales bacterium]|jgi:L-cystine transport system ATP-binding protein|nr:amino acid ABC transporter ATP-binding protein [Coriobacteriales bacterium]